MTPLSILSKSEYYAPTPILKSDATKRLSDFNIASRVLLGSDVAGYQHQPIANFFTAMAPRVEGDFRPPLTGESVRTPGDAGESHDTAPGEEKTGIDAFQSSAFKFRTPSFGLADLRSTSFEMTDPDSGQLSGTTVFLEIREIEKEQSFNEHLRREWKQQLGWDIYAISYDRVLPNVLYYQEVVARHVHAFSSSDIVEILDVGGGTGNIAMPLVRQDKHVTVVDTSRAMLDKLRCKLEGSEHRNLSVLEQSAEDLSQWDDASFDGVNLQLTLFNMENPKSALTEAIRVLRSCGLLVVTEAKRSFDLQAVLDLAGISLRQNGMYEELEEDLKRVVRVNRAIDPSLRSSLFVEDIRKILREVGLLEMWTEESHQGNCLTVCAKKPEVT